MEGVTLLSGGGCAAVGMRDAGVELVGAVEIDPAIAATYQTNLGDHVVVAPIEDADPLPYRGIGILQCSPVHLYTMEVLAMPDFCPVCSQLTGAAPLMDHLKYNHTNRQIREWVSDHATDPADLADLRQSYRALETIRDAARAQRDNAYKDLQQVITERNKALDQVGCTSQQRDAAVAELDALRSPTRDNSPAAPQLLRVDGHAVALLNALAWFARNAVNPDGIMGWGASQSMESAQLEWHGPAHKLLIALTNYTRAANWGADVATDTAGVDLPF